MSAPLSVRIRNVSSLLKIPEKDISKVLTEEGITDDSMSILDSPAVTLEDLCRVVEKMGDIKPLLAKAAAGMLKDMSTRPVANNKAETEKKMPVVLAESLQQVFKASRPISQWSDRELLEKFSEERDPQVEQELNNRAKNKNFVVLIPGDYAPGKEQINIELTLELLKTARKKTNPSMIPYEDKICPVYRITELNLQDRIVDYCPVCGETLYRGFCEKCGLNFSSAGQDERAYVNLISKSETFNAKSYSDRKAVLASAVKGIEDLKKTWPSLAKAFDELKVTGNLPTLRTIETRPTTTVKILILLMEIVLSEIGNSNLRGA